MTSKKQHTLGKQERLKSRKQIEQLFKDAASFNMGFLKIYHQLQKDGNTSSLQFGAGVGKRHFKKAVQRNRVKRLIREAWRLNNHSFKHQLKEKGQSLNVFFIFTGKELPEFETVVEKTKATLQKLQSIYA